MNSTRRASISSLPTPIAESEADRPNGATIGETTYRRLRDMILSDALSAGDALQEKKLADMLGVSRTPIREAITRLTTEGLVERVIGLTPVVRRLSANEFIEILHVRRLLEVEAAGRAAETGGSETLRAIMTRIQRFRAGEMPTPAEHVAVDDALHSSVASLAGSRVLAELIRDLRQKTKIFDMGQVPERFEPGIAEHLEIIDAILARDVTRAQDAMRTHIDNVRSSVIDHLRRLF
ncbi:MAG: GntR family transcriptional regulator [Beijerinckiaceae bacterium]|nr:GntR family transcriptional regulator [Beijerinckiaceae bacterium]